MRIRNVKITIDKNKCLGCGNCQEACSHHVLEKQTINGKNEILIVNSSSCTGCLHCMSTCKENAIEITRYC